MTKIKICGLTRREDIEAVNHAAPDYAGFVFANSRRQVTFAQAAILKKELMAEILAVGVFVNEPMENVLLAVEERIIDVIQLHGDESMEYVRAIKKHTQTPIIKAFRVKDDDVTETAAQFLCEYLLFDAYTPGSYGGTGEGFRWQTLDGVLRPYFLAGGLQEGNLATALHMLRPFAVDISSGAETNGVKDAEKIQKLVSLVRRMNHE